ncbi:hypothetical protein [Micromonospora tulbaghiae]
MLADVDATRVREGRGRIVALAGRMHVVPAHDVRAHDPIPLWIGSADQG